VNQTGVVSALARNVHNAAAALPLVTSRVAGIVVAFSSDLVNNLPMRLIAAATNYDAQAPVHAAGAILIGVDLRPNLSIFP
jgi:arsenical pump membrane protein